MKCADKQETIKTPGKGNKLGLEIQGKEELLKSIWGGNFAMFGASPIPGLGRSSGEGKGYPLQYSGLENSMDYTVHEVTKSRT